MSRRPSTTEHLARDKVSRPTAGVAADAPYQVRRTLLTRYPLPPDGIVKLLTWCGAASIGRCGDCGEVQGLSVSDRGHRARGVAVSPFRDESA